MTEDEHLQKHLQLCKRIYLRLKAEGKWPWTAAQDSPDIGTHDRVRKTLIDL
jgi:hypothetical protein